MSAFTTAQTKLTDLSALRKALMKMGWKESQIEMHATPQKLEGYHREQSHKAELIIRRKNLGGHGAYNDLGFTKQADGTVQVIGEYAGKYGHIKRGDFTKKLTQNYALAKLEDELEGAGFFIDQVENRDGKIFVSAENPYM